jgi:hypothetical protein
LTSSKDCGGTGICTASCHSSRFAAWAEYLALELRQLRGQQGHLRVGLLPQRLEGRARMHEQVLECLHIIGQACAIDGSAQQLHGHA